MPLTKPFKFIKAFQILCKFIIDTLDNTSNAFIWIVRRTKIRIRLLVALVLLSIIPLSIIGIISYELASTAVDSKIRKYSEQIITQAEDIVSREMRNLDTVTNELLSSEGFQECISLINSGVSGDIMNSLDKLKQVSTPKFAFLKSITQAYLVIDNDGYIIYSKSTAQAFSVQNIQHLLELADEAGGASVWAFQTKETIEGLKENCIILTRMLRSKDMEKIGYMLITLHEPDYADTYKNIDMGDDSEFFVIDKSGIIVSSKNPSEVSLEYSDKNLLSEITKNLDNSIKVFKYDKYLISTSRLVANKDWFIVGKVPLKYLNKETDDIAIYLITTALLCILMIIILTALITRSIYMPIKKLTGFMFEAKNGNLTIDVKDDGRDEIGQLTVNFKMMIENIRKLIKDVNSIIVKVSKDADFVAASSELSYSTSSNIAQIIDSIAQGAAEQARQAGIGVENITKLSEGISSVGHKMLNVSRSVANTRDLSQSSLLTSELLNDKAKLTSTASKNIIDNIEELTDYMKKIKNILKIIVNISDQTNLISVNASIEAAKGGKTASGFAVVATEIKKLAGSSKASVANITELIKTIKEKADSAINEANNSHETIERQMEAVNETSKAFKEISKEMEEIFDHVNNVDASLKEVLEFKEEAIENIKKIAEVSQEAAATSEEVTAATQQQIAQAQELSDFANNLKELSQKLMKSISNFKI